MNNPFTIDQIESLLSKLYRGNINTETFIRYLNNRANLIEIKELNPLKASQKITITIVCDEGLREDLIQEYETNLILDFRTAEHIAVRNLKDGYSIKSIVFSDIKKIYM